MVFLRIKSRDRILFIYLFIYLFASNS
jgi:hypothetical protein